VIGRPLKEHFVVEANIVFEKKEKTKGRSQQPCGLRCGSEAARLMGLWVRIPPLARMSCTCCQVGFSRPADHPYREALPKAVCLNKCDRDASMRGGGEMQKNTINTCSAQNAYDYLG